MTKLMKLSILVAGAFRYVHSNKYVYAADQSPTKIRRLITQKQLDMYEDISALPPVTVDNRQAAPKRLKALRAFSFLFQ